MNRKENRPYRFSVEGKCEKWYLDHLRSLLAADCSCNYHAIITADVEPSPLKYSKKAKIISTPRIFHICDYESDEPQHVKKFQSVLKEIQQVRKDRKIKYDLAYCNFTFELWMILHKMDCNTQLADRKQYLQMINASYAQNRRTQFQSLKEYKEENNFKYCLSQLTLDDVQAAINRSKKIMRTNEENYHPERHCGFTYYSQNPALTLWESIEWILSECLQKCK